MPERSRRKRLPNVRKRESEYKKNVPPTYMYMYMYTSLREQDTSLWKPRTQHQHTHHHHPLFPLLPHRKQALLRAKQRHAATREECRALLEKLSAVVASCAYPSLLPETARKAYEMGRQVLMAVQTALEEQSTPDEEQVTPEIYIHVHEYYAE